MKAIELLKHTLELYQHSLDKSTQHFKSGVIDKTLHAIHTRNLEPLIEEYKTAIIFLENSKDKIIEKSVVIYFKMQSTDAYEERINFTKGTTDEEIVEYFENQCGGVSYWRHSLNV